MTYSDTQQHIMNCTLHINSYSEVLLRYLWLREHVLRTNHIRCEGSVVMCGMQ